MKKSVTQGSPQSESSHASGPVPTMIDGMREKKHSRAQCSSRRASASARCLSSPGKVENRPSWLLKLRTLPLNLVHLRRPARSHFAAMVKLNACVSECMHYDVTMSRKPSHRTSRRLAAARLPVTVRLPEEVVKKIDQELEQREVPVSRNNWFLEAAIEKLRKNGTGGSRGAK
jgi:hypothetical protein